MPRDESTLTSHLNPRRGESILDLGCGHGEDLAQVLALAPGVRVVGLDRSDQAIRAARRRLAGHVKSGAAELVCSDAGEPLPFPSRSFHAVTSAELLECIAPSKQKLLLKEIHRVLKPRGRVVVGHTDWDTQIWNARDRELERRLVHAFCDWTQGWMEHSDGWMGRRLLGLFRRSKMFAAVHASAFSRIEDRYEPGAFGYARARDFLTRARKNGGILIEEARRFLRDLASQSKAGTYFYSVTRFVITAKVAN